MARAILLVATMTTAMLMGAVRAQEMSFNPDYVGSNAFSSSMDRVIAPKDGKKKADPRAPISRTGSTQDARMQALQAEYMRRYREDGEVSANAWAREMGRRDAEAARRHASDQR